VKKIFINLCLFLFVLLLMPQLIRAEEVEVQVIVQKANVRAKAELNSEVVIQVSLGTVLKSDLQEGNWFRIFLPPDEKGERKYAYIHSSLVEVVTQAKPAEPVQPVKTEQAVQKKVLGKEKLQPEVKKEQPTQQVKPMEPSRIKAPPKGGMEFGLRLYGGGSFFLFGRNDINRHFQGTNDLWDDLDSLFPTADLSGEFKEMKTGMNISGEFFFNFTPQVGIGLGVGTIQTGEKESGVALEESGNSYELKATPKISAIPILFTAYFGIPIGNAMDIVAHAGGGFYLGTVQYDNLIYLSESGLWAQYEATWSAKSSSFGFHGGLGFAFHLGRFMDLVLDISGRMVNFKNLTADADWTVTSNVSPSESGTDNDQTLWFYESETDGTWYPQVELNNTKPSASYMRNVEEAVVGLSGLSLQFGIKFKLNELFMR
jgi:hypothetical protein